MDRKIGREDVALALINLSQQGKAVRLHPQRALANSCGVGKCFPAY